MHVRAGGQLRDARSPLRLLRRVGVERERAGQAAAVVADDGEGGAGGGEVLQTAEDVVEVEWVRLRPCAL